MRGYRSTQMD